jgi:hypothetical protein
MSFSFMETVQDLNVCEVRLIVSFGILQKGKLTTTISDLRTGLAQS